MGEANEFWLFSLVEFVSNVLWSEECRVSGMHKCYSAGNMVEGFCTGDVLKDGFQVLPTFCNVF